MAITETATGIAAVATATSAAAAATAATAAEHTKLNGHQQEQELFCRITIRFSWTLWLFICSYLWSCQAYNCNKLIGLSSQKTKTCLDEFMVLDEDDLSNQRPYITGHNRLYHHTETRLPVHPKELDIDSEGESDPLWLRQNHTNDR
ncbi:Polycomb protein Su(z)12 [Eumeta japonica]|uniref:Polycomb protein Su(Z)12 n=1 Tax=Eumeta variegata TaxID=151549 RepID=A0A4C1SIY6_EUMVA|nr:Polycomb protein Su(z)12 [Eumeta japonica]